MTQFGMDCSWGVAAESPETQVDSEHHIWSTAEQILACDVPKGITESAVVVSWCNTAIRQRLPQFAHAEDPHGRSKHNDELRDERQNNTQAPKGLTVEWFRREVAQRMNELWGRSPRRWLEELTDVPNEEDVGSDSLRRVSLIKGVEDPAVLCQRRSFR